MTTKSSVFASSMAYLVTAGLAANCGSPSVKSLSSTRQADVVATESPLDPALLAKVKAALPKVAFPKLQAMLESNSTIWYDHDSMAPTYQAAIKQSPPVGANSNDKWFDLVADSVHGTANHFYDTSKKKWRFPFGTTAGTDAVTNMKVVDFVYLPSKDGKLLPIATYLSERPTSAFGGFTLNSWGWIYPNGAVVAEVIFIKNGDDLLPVEIRTRTRYPSAWAVNAFRPFPTAASLSAAIKQRRPNWVTDAKLKTLVNHLDGDSPMTPKSLTSTNLPGTFDQSGALDVLPDFGDDALVRALLKETPFVSSYKQAWKASGSQVSYAASTNAEVSIVPKNYEAGVIAVDEASCSRCHREAGKGLTSFSPQFSDIVLYGEMWGRDGIFSFHPFDEVKYSEFWFANTTDNRRMNPSLKNQGIIVALDKSQHKAPEYPTKEYGLGLESPDGPGAPSPDPTPAPDGGDTTDGKIVEFHIPAGTGSGEWNLQASPARAKAGQTVRIINDDTTTHVLHTNGEPCPHGDTSRPLRKGEHYDCDIPSGTSSGSNFRLWDHFLGDPNSGRFWIQVK